jgi:rhodanese-related sulfurtransferase
MDAAPASSVSLSLSFPKLRALLAQFPPPTLVDVRRNEAFTRDAQLLPTAIKRDPDALDAWARELEPWRAVVVYCAHGREVSQNAAAALAARGVDACYVEGGLEAWRAAGGATRPARAATRWVTRERPKIDRIACPWLIRRFIDPDAQFAYVPKERVRAYAAETGMTPYDIPDVEFSHVGPECSFDAFIHKYKLEGVGYAALAALATIVRGADTGKLELAPQAPGLLALSLGLSRTFADDHAMLRWGMLCYDALFAWCRDAQGETRSSRPEFSPR